MIISVQVMDWFSWLSKTSLHQSLAYEYALIFSRNELDDEDRKSLNHEILQSMGISVAKHRLEILKLVKKEINGVQNPLINVSSRLILSIQNAGKSIKRIGQRVFRSSEPEMSPVRSHRTRALRKHHSAKEFNHEKVMVTNMKIFKSGPLERRVVQEGLRIATKRENVSGPSACRPINEIVFSPKLNNSPYGNGNRKENRDYENGHGHESLWSLMFQDMKPT